MTIVWVAHLLAVVLWIGALAFVMTVLQAAARGVICRLRRSNGATAFQHRRILMPKPTQADAEAAVRTLIEWAGGGRFRLEWIEWW